MKHQQASLLISRQERAAVSSQRTTLPSSGTLCGEKKQMLFSPCQGHSIFKPGIVVSRRKWVPSQQTPRLPVAALYFNGKFQTYPKVEKDSIENPHEPSLGFHNCQHFSCIFLDMLFLKVSWCLKTSCCVVSMRSMNQLP